jgi:hypothetical protein
MGTTLEYGACEKCGKQNLKTLSECRQCGAPLSWAKSTKVAKTQSNDGGISVGFYIAILGGIIFCAGVFLWFGNVFGFFPTVRYAGYITAVVGAATWKAGLNM